MKNQNEQLRNQSHSPLQQKIKYLGINLPKEAKELYTENYKTLMKEIKDDIKQMERYSMFLGGKNKYCGNDYRWQPTRLPRPWDSPGKNTGVGCHFLLQCRKVKSGSEVAQSCLTPSDPMDCSLIYISIYFLE